jgi:hypothetical protein
MTPLAFDGPAALRPLLARIWESHGAVEVLRLSHLVFPELQALRADLPGLHEHVCCLEMGGLDL